MNIEQVRQAVAASEAAVAAGHAKVDTLREQFALGKAPRGAWLARQRKLGQAIEALEVGRARLRRMERAAAAAATPHTPQQRRKDLPNDR